MDKHLNLFKFFNSSAYEYWEDNLSRAFAICLQNDITLLSNVLQKILSNEQYTSTFSSEYPGNVVEIDLQRKVSTLENFNYIYGVACSALKIDNENLKNTVPQDTENPETDLLITLGDICILFEFKRTNEDCSAQLARQVEIVKKNSPGVQSKMINFDWSEIIKISLSVISLERQGKQENIFLKNFIDFIKDYNPSWFPCKMLSQVVFPKNSESYDDPNVYYLDQRLNSIKDFVFGAEKTKWIADRYIISIEEKWAQELNIGYETVGNEDFITVDIYPGDTKRQGWGYFKENKTYNWANKRINSCKVMEYRYLKFSHFNKGITWLKLTEEESAKTHNYNFFSDCAGRYNAGWHKDWQSQLNNKISEIIPDWKDRTDWGVLIEKSNRNYIDLSIGTHLQVLIPYKEAIKLDDVNSIENKLAKKVKTIYEEIANEINT